MDDVKKGETIFTLYASNEEKLNYAVKFMREYNPIFIEPF